MNLIGELLRYGEAQTSLMLVDSVIEEDWGIRVYGLGCMGGRVGANIEDLMVETEEDWTIWDQCERWRRMREEKRGAG